MRVHESNLAVPRFLCDLCAYSEFSVFNFFLEK